MTGSIAGARKCVAIEFATCVKRTPFPGPAVPIKLRRGAHTGPLRALVASRVAVLSKAALLILTCPRVITPRLPPRWWEQKRFRYGSAGRFGVVRATPGRTPQQ